MAFFCLTVCLICTKSRFLLIRIALIKDQQENGNMVRHRKRRKIIYRIEFRMKNKQ